MILLEFLSVFVDQHQTGVAENTVVCFYKPAISSFQKHLGRAPELKDLNDETINDWTKSGLAKKVNLVTLAKRRSAILALWRYADLIGRVPFGPRRIRKLPKVTRVVDAWTREEVVKLLDAIAKSNWTETTMPKSVLNKADFFHSLALAGYETGLRLGDLLDIERDWLRVDETGAAFVTVVQSKTRVTKTSKIEASTMVVIDRLMAQDPNRRLIWPLNIKRPCLYRAWRQIVKSAGVRRGTFRWMRRAGTTHVEEHNPGCGYLHAGHTDSRVTAAHYIDRSQLQSRIVSPTPLIGLGSRDMQFETVCQSWPRLPVAMRQTIYDLVQANLQC